jgi:hypothetical protein
VKEVCRVFAIGIQADVLSVAQYQQEVDNADSALERSDESVRHSF